MKSFLLLLHRLTHTLPHPRLVYASRALGIFAVFFVATLFGDPADAVAYSTDWMGNSFSGTNNAHLPNGIEAIAVLPNGTTYMNSWWDEAGGEVSAFTTAPAWMNINGFLHGFGRAGGYAIAANSTYIYVACSQGENGNNPIKTGTSAGQPFVNGNGLANFPVNNTGAPNYTTVTGNYWDCIRRYTLAGGVSAIPTYGYSSDRSMIIVSTTENDSQIGTGSNPDGASIGSSGPIMGLAANDTYVFASDTVNNKIHIYNASTMAPVATWNNIPSPGRMTLDTVSGILWVVQNHNNNASSSIVGYNSTSVSSPILKGGSIACGTGQQIRAPYALAVDSAHRLVVADNGLFPDTITNVEVAPFQLYLNPDVSKLVVYTTGGANPVYSSTFGSSVFSGSTPGRVTPLGFHGITGIGFDSAGNFYVSCKGDPHDVGSGTYLRKFNTASATATQTWQITGLQFVGGGSLDRANLNQFYSSYSGYSMNWANSPLTGTGNGTVATWNMDLFNPGLYPTDKGTADLTSDWLVPGSNNNAPIDETHAMVFEVRSISGKPFLFTDAMNMGNVFGVMRMNGNVAVPAVLFGYNHAGWPKATIQGKKYVWVDNNGDGCMQTSEFTTDPNPFPIVLCGKWVDETGNLWTVNRFSGSNNVGQITEVPLAATPLNAYGVPQYNISTPINKFAAGTNNVTTDTDWVSLVELAYLPSSDTMILAGNTTTHNSGTTNNFNVVRSYPNWSTATTSHKIGHAWEADGTSWKGLYAIGDYVFASEPVNNVNAISTYSLSTGALAEKFVPVGVSPTGLNDEDNPINVRVLPDGTYVIFQENDLTNNLTFYRWSPNGIPLGPIANGTYNVVVQSSGLSLATNASSVVQQTYTGTATQKWTVTNLGSNVVEMVSSGGSAALEVPGGSTTAGTYLDVSAYTGATYQKWTLTPKGNGYYNIINVNSGLAANVAGNYMNSGAGICQWTAGNFANTNWKFLVP
jgi:Ricin-type beta-trefoil lectin domain-like